MYWRIYIMKKRLLALLFVVVLCLSGCQNEETAKKDALEKAFENIGMEHSAVIMNVLSKEWNVVGGEDTYTFTKEGTGDISGEAFTYSCDFKSGKQLLVTDPAACTATAFLEENLATGKETFQLSLSLQAHF